MNWNEDNIVTLGKLFLRNVKDNMRGYNESTVRFGETGQGIRPNYQVTLPNGRAIAYNGASHDQFTNADAFNDDKISQAFSYQQICRSLDLI